VTTTTQRPTRRFTTPAWTWSFLFAIVVLIGIFVTTHSFSLGTIGLALSLAPYLVMVGSGQMLVISAGPGNIDVSVPQIISLAGFVAVSVTASTHSVTLGLLAAAGTGLAVAIISAGAILFIKIPPIVATLASGLIASSFTLTFANGFDANPSAALSGFLRARIAGIPWIAIITAVFTLALVLFLRRTVLGRSLLATGQNQRSASFAGIRTSWVTASTYLVSGVLSGLAGALLATYIAPTADLGTTYQLDSIAVVVIGGTLISGGRAVPAGVWGGALFFILLDSFLNLIGWNLAGQNILKGLLVLAVLFLAGGVARTRKSARAAATPPVLTVSTSVPVVDDATGLEAAHASATTPSAGSNA
jgi:ribose transport system permease protein